MGVRAGWIGLAVLAAAAAGWWLLRGDAETPEPLEDPAERAAASEAPRPALTPAAPRNAAPATAVGDPPTKAPARPRRTGLEGALAELPREVGRLEGTVRDADGKPVAGATVQVLRPPTVAEVEVQRARGSEPLGGGWGVFLSKGPEDLTTDAAGRFALNDVPLGIQLFVRVGSAQGSWSGTLERLEGPLEVSLPRLHSIRGRVLDAAAGFPAPNVRVSATPEGAGEQRETTTGASGEFELHGLPAGDYLVRALPFFKRSDSLGMDRALPPAGMEREATVRAAAGDERLELRVWRGYVISGRVETQEGREPGVRVVIDVYARSAAGEPDQRRRATATTAADGSFEIDALPSGAYELQFQPPADPSGSGDAVASTWVHDVRAPAADLRVVLLRGAAIRGRLEDAEQRPVTVSGGMVYVREQGTVMGGVHSLFAVLDGKGGFSTPPVATGRAYVLLVRIPGFAQVEVAEVFPGTEVVVRLGPARRLRGRVLAPDGTPVPMNVPVAAWAESGSLSAPGAAAYASTGPGGEFVLEGLTGERYSVAAGGGGSTFGPCEPLRGVPLGEEPITLHVPDGVKLSGRLVDPRGNPVQTINLQAAGVTGTLPNLANVAGTRVDDHEGRFLIAGLKQGRVRLLLYRDGKAVPLGEFEAPAQNVKVVVPDP